MYALACRQNKPLMLAKLATLQQVLLLKTDQSGLLKRRFGSDELPNCFFDWLLLPRLDPELEPFPLRVFVENFLFA